eukprot:3931340-Alexandrium_andersonii.AAC.1
MGDVPDDDPGGAAVEGSDDQSDQSMPDVSDRGYGTSRGTRNYVLRDDFDVVRVATGEAEMPYSKKERTFLESFRARSAVALPACRSRPASEAQGG